MRFLLKFVVLRPFVAVYLEFDELGQCFVFWGFFKIKVLIQTLYLLKGKLQQKNEQK